MELNTLPRTSAEQSCYSNPTGYPKVSFTFGNDSFVPLGIFRRNHFAPSSQMTASLFYISSSAIDISYTDSKQEVILFKEKISEILNILSISKKTLCSVLSITRPTLYSWLDNEKIEPEASNSRKVSDLYVLIKELNISSPIYHAYVEEKMDGETDSLLDILTQASNVYSNTEARCLLQKAYNLTCERNRKLDSLLNGLNKISVSRQELIMEDNINSL